MEYSEQISQLFAGLEDGSATLVDADGLALQIADQNARYHEANTLLVDEPEILDIVHFGIAEEQEESFANILAIAPESSLLYKSLGKASLAIDKGLEITDARVNELAPTVKEQEAALEELLIQQKHRQKTEELLATVKRLAPRSVEAVVELLDSRGIKLVSNQEINDLEDAVIDLMDQEDQASQELEKLKVYSVSLDEKVGQLAVSWELPLALMDQNRSIFAVLDELPVEPVPIDCPDGEVKKFTERHIDQPKAALYAALCLTEHSGQTVTVDQIARALYSKEVIADLSEHHLRSRVTSTLGPKVRGEALSEILDQEGHILQYGWRRILEQKTNGHTAIVRRHRIYRAIRKDQVGDYSDQNTFETDDYVDNFEPMRIYNDSEDSLPEPSVITGTTTPAAASSDVPHRYDDTVPIIDTVRDNTSARDDRNETNAQRKERLKHELLSSISGCTRSIIKTIAHHGALERGGITVGHLKNVFITDISDEAMSHIVSSRVTPNDNFWLKNVDAVRLMLSITHEDESTRANVRSRQWGTVINDLIKELIQRELRGIERRESLKAR